VAATVPFWLAPLAVHEDTPVGFAIALIVPLPALWLETEPLASVVPDTAAPPVLHTLRYALTATAVTLPEIETSQSELSCWNEDPLPMLIEPVELITDTPVMLLPPVVTSPITLIV
jgi:hypothetical protein